MLDSFAISYPPIDQLVMRSFLQLEVWSSNLELNEINHNVANVMQPLRHLESNSVVCRIKRRRAPQTRYTHRRIKPDSHRQRCRFK